MLTNRPPTECLNTLHFDLFFHWIVTNLPVEQMRALECEAFLQTLFLTAPTVTEYDVMLERIIELCNEHLPPDDTDYPQVKEKESCNNFYSQQSANVPAQYGNPYIWRWAGFTLTVYAVVNMVKGFKKWLG